MKYTPGEFAFLMLLRAAVLALPPFLLYIRPVTVYRCQQDTRAVSCAIERRAAGLIRLSRTEIAGIRHAEGGVVTRRFTSHEPGRPQQTYNASSTVGSLLLLGADDQVLYREELDNTVGRDPVWLAAAINRLAEGTSSAPILVWNVTWPTSLFATVLLLAIVPGLISEVLRRLPFRATLRVPSEVGSPREHTRATLTPTEARELRALLPGFILVAVICAAAWTLAILGRLPAPLADALGVPSGV